jgi:hypothetical protein
MMGVPSLVSVVDEDESVPRSLSDLVVEQGAVACLFKLFSARALIEAIDTKLRVG